MSHSFAYFELFESKYLSEILFVKISIILGFKKFVKLTHFKRGCDYKSKHMNMSVAILYLQKHYWKLLSVTENNSFNASYNLQTMDSGFIKVFFFFPPLIGELKR